MTGNNIWTKLKTYLAILVIIKIYNFLIVDNIFFTLGINSISSNFQNISIIGFISAIFIAPIIEEIIFRTHLSFKKKHFFGLILLLLAFAMVFNSSGWFFTVIAVSLSILILVFYNKFQYLVQIKYQNGTFIVTSILFCLIHYSYLNEYNFSVLEKIGLLLLHYLPLSLFLGVLRKKFGLVPSMGAHSLNNFLSIVGNSLLYV